MKGVPHFKKYVYISCLDTSYLIPKYLQFLCVLAFVVRVKGEKKTKNFANCVNESILLSFNFFFFRKKEKDTCRGIGKGKYAFGFHEIWNWEKQGCFCQ